MADKKADDILEEMKSAQEAQAEENRKKYEEEKNALAAQAQSGADTQSAGAAADYQNFSSPDNKGGGIQADAISRLGLNKGVLSQTNQAGGYNAYRSRLAAAARQAQNAKDQLDLSYNLYNKQADAAKTNAGANYNSLKNSDYWKQAEWDYQLAADKKAEEEARKAAAQHSHTGAGNTSYTGLMPRINDDGSAGTNWRKGENSDRASVITTPAGARAAERIAMFKQQVLDQATLSMIVNSARDGGATNAELEYLIYLGGY